MRGLSKIGARPSKAACFLRVAQFHSMKLNTANIVEHIHQEISKEKWDWEKVMKAGQALGVAEKKDRYAEREFSYTLFKLCYKALKAFGLSKAERKPKGPVAWRRKIYELWTAGELDTDKAGQIVREYATNLMGKMKPDEPKPPKHTTWACAGVMGAHFKIEHDTAVALCKALEHMNYWTCGFLNGESFYGERINRQVNEMIRAAAEAVTNFVPKSSLRFRAPYVFTARDESHAEREMRLMLESLAK